MDGLFLVYLPIVIVVGLSGGEMVLSYLIASPDNETPCGFDAFEDARRDVRLIAVLFIIFPRHYS